METITSLSVEEIKSSLQEQVKSYDPCAEYREQTDWKKFWDRPRHEIMKDFADRMNELYNMAEGLRDMASGKDKEIFNQTRGALYDLVYRAKQQHYDWKPEEK